MRERLDYLYAGIADQQSTIRSIDMRVGFLLLILCAPVPLADKLLDGVRGLECASHVQQTLCGCAVLIWLLALVALFNSAGAISDPAKHIKGKCPSGTFYGGGLFKLGFADAFINRNVFSRHELQDEINRLPSKIDDIVSELVFEKFKLTYIREIKITRYTTSLRLTLAWILLCLVILLIHWW